MRFGPNQKPAELHNMHAALAVEDEPEDVHAMDDVPRNKVRTPLADFCCSGCGNSTVGCDFNMKTSAPMPTNADAHKAYKMKRTVRIGYPNKKATQNRVAFIVRKVLLNYLVTKAAKWASSTDMATLPA